MGLDGALGFTDFRPAGSLTIPQVSSMPLSLNSIGVRMLGGWVSRCWLPQALVAGSLSVGLVGAESTAAEPAQEFVARLRGAGYYDTAVVYLDRADRLPGCPRPF
jgi:hypothetical protein